MTVALCLAGLALIGPAEEFEAPLPRRRLPLGLTVPDAPAWWGFFALFTLCTLPQLIVFSIQLQMSGNIFGYHVRTIGLVPMGIYFAAFFFGLWWCARAKNRRQLYLFSAYVLGAMATLAKGPAGIALPGLVLLLWLVTAGRWRDIYRKLEIPRGLVLFIATGCPWYHAMLIRHGAPFWMEFIGDNYVHRAEGRHGDRGTFEYYLQYLGYGMFPWSGIATVGAALGLTKLRDKSPRAQLIGFAIVWFLVEFTTVSLVNTKFHHYILPALPALAILAALGLEELFTERARALRIALTVIGVPVTLLCARDLAAFPARILWMFNYDYVNMPGTGRPWPTVAQFGQRYEYGTVLLAIGLACAAATLLAIWLARPQAEAVVDSMQGDGPYRSMRVRQEAEERVVSAGGWLAGAALFVVLLVVAILAGPATPRGAAPKIGPWLWLVPTACMVPVVIAVAVSISRVSSSKSERPGISLSARLMVNCISSAG